MSAVGFTGTRAGLTAKQRVGLSVVLEHLRTSHSAFHHGDCIGADAEAAVIAQRLGYRIHVHPAEVAKGKRAFTPAVQYYPILLPLQRNRNIVDACDVLVACPRFTHEEQRSGTWATIRYARKAGKHVLAVWPDGELEQERAKE